MMELFAFVILLTLTEAQENQWERPENTSSIVGSNVTLKCSSPSGDCSLIEWLKQGGNPTIVFSGIIASAYRSRYRVDNFSGCDLVIEDVELRDAGRFICRAFISHDTVEKTVFLTISAELGYKLAGPENAISAVGSNVTLRCSSPSRNCDGTEWLKYGASGNLGIISNDRGVISNTYGDRYRVDNSSGCDLVIKNVEYTDAGRFICRAFISSQTVEKSAYLVILETQPSCTLNISLNETAEGDRIRLTCEVKYCGTNKATILWKDVKNTGETQPKAVEVKATQLNCKVTSHATSMGTHNGTTISWSYYVKASTSDFSSFTCITSFALDDAKTNGTQIKGSATDIPSATCETPVIKVLYSVRNVTLSPSRSFYSPGNDIICTARGNPSPIFKWQEMDNDGTWTEIQNLNGSKFTITNASFKRYRCIAMNVVRGKTHNATSHEFHVKNIDSAVPPSTTPSLVLESTATIATTGSTTVCTSGCNCDVAVPAAIAVGAILFISLALNIMQLIIMVKNMRTKHDPFKRAGTNRTILSPETLDLSNEPPAPATYEELTRSNEIHLQPTYDKLTPKPPAPATYQELTHPNEIHLQPPTYEKLATKPSSYVDNLS